MEFKKSLFCLSLITALSPAIAQAEQPSYSFIDAGYTKFDFDDLDLDPSGFAIRGSVEVAENWFIQAGYFNADDTNGLIDVEAEQLNLGAGFKMAMGDNTSFHVTLDYLNVEVEADHQFGSSASADEDGYGLGVGLRSMVAQNFELNAGASYADLGDEDGLEFDVGAVWYLTENLGLVAEVGFDDDSNRQYLIGGRLSF